MPDKRGPWLVVVTDQTEEWNAGHKPRPFIFKARPETLWAIISRKPYVIDGFAIPVVDPPRNGLR